MEDSVFEGQLVWEPVIPLVDLEALGECSLEDLEPYSPDVVASQVMIELTLRFPDSEFVRVIGYVWHDWHRWGLLVCPELIVGLGVSKILYP